MDEELSPIENQDIEILILGTYPGRDSLETPSQYYKNKDNCFWEIINSIGEGKDITNYEDKNIFLLNKKIGLWDVLKKCKRKNKKGNNTSKDNDIDINKSEPNDFFVFFKKHKKIRVILFNGMLSFKIFNKRILNNLTNRYFLCFVLPSTSKSNTNYSKNEKIKLWRDQLTLMLKLMDKFK